MGDEILPKENADCICNGCKYCLRFINNEYEQKVCCCQEFDNDEYIPIPDFCEHCYPKKNLLGLTIKSEAISMRLDGTTRKHTIVAMNGPTKTVRGVGPSYFTAAQNAKKKLSKGDFI